MARSRGSRLFRASSNMGMAVRRAALSSGLIRATAHTLNVRRKSGWLLSINSRNGIDRRLGRRSDLAQRIGGHDADAAILFGQGVERAATAGAAGGPMAPRLRTASRRTSTFLAVSSKRRMPAQPARRRRRSPASARQAQ